MPEKADDHGAWRVVPRRLRILAVCVGLLGLALPGAVVRWVTTTSSPPEQPDAGPLRPEMVVVPAGSYTIGSPESEEGRSPGEEQHQVTLGSFAIAVTEVTQEQYERVMGENPSSDKSCGSDCPVTDVSWLDAVRYSNRLSKLDPVTEACYGIDGEQVDWIEGCMGYRLPTEAEWEVAARATTTDRYAGTDDPEETCLYGNVGDSRFKEAENPPWDTFECDDGWARLAPVQSFRPDGFRLYDMTGNVWEWVWDWYEPEYKEDARDPRGPASGQYRVYRGGSFDDDPQSTRVAYRDFVVPSFRISYLGFRVARSLP